MLTYQRDKKSDKQNVINHTTTRRFLHFFFLVSIFCLLTVAKTEAQYLHTSGTQIVDADNREVILRGMGLGGWMLQEGYMLQTSKFANPQHKIRAAIQDLIGEDATSQFYDAWLANHCTRTDIDSLASWGFNSVRLPMHYNLYTLPVDEEPVAGKNTWLDKGFEMTDSLLQWCADNQMYLILDLHGAPGGQGNDIPISDNDTTKASLWESEANRQKTVALWRKLAERYANEPWMGGYDLINETNWNFEEDNINGCDETTNAPLKALLLEITRAIREVDQHHIIYIEGNCWANNHNGLWPAWDDNLVLSFHKYWNYNDPQAIANMVKMRDQYQVPLWLGESGENGNTWFTNAIKLMEENHIGWAWWPLKKVGSVVNPLTVKKNTGYGKLLDYWENGGDRPSQEMAQKALMQLAENLKIENCIYHPDVIDAMFRQVNSTDTKPFVSQAVPGVVQATNYDLGRNGEAYLDQDTANYRVSTGESVRWNQGGAYRNDGVDIAVSNDDAKLSNGYYVGWTEEEEWLCYTITVDSAAVYNIDIRYASPKDGGKIEIDWGGEKQRKIVTLPATGSENSWQNVTMRNVTLRQGAQQLTVKVLSGGFNLEYLDFKINKAL